MKIVLGLLFCIVFSYGGVFDFFYTYKGESLQKEGKRGESLKYYKKVENKTDAIHYNMGNIYYKEKKYKEAISSYEKVKEGALRYKKLHNLGNSYAQENNLNKAIESYEEALKIKKDKDTLYNLELLKKIEENKKNQNDSQKGENNQTNKIEPQNGKKEKNEGVKSPKDKQAKEEITQEESDKRQAKVDEKVRKSNELSDLEEKKWSQLLENRDIKTLIIPMTKSGEKNDANIKPW